MTRIRKNQARELFDNGHTIIAIPHKLNPDNQFFGMGAVLQKYDGTLDFNKLCDKLAYYSCTNETGRYLAFYYS